MAETLLGCDFCGAEPGLEAEVAVVGLGLRLCRSCRRIPHGRLREGLWRLLTELRLAGVEVRVSASGGWR